MIRYNADDDGNNYIRANNFTVFSKRVMMIVGAIFQTFRST
jgi:hypothetical protein